MNDQPTQPSHDPAVTHVGGGNMPDWGVAELPDPPRLKGGWSKMLGPGILMAGAAIGGGEWLLGPATTAQYGGIIMWLAMASILAQIGYNIEVMRYAVFCGESIFVGWFRLLPGPRFWTCVYLFVDFFGLWPYLAANAAVPLAAAFIGHLPGALPIDYETIDSIAQRTGAQVQPLNVLKAARDDVKAVEKKLTDARLTRTLTPELLKSLTSDLDAAKVREAKTPVPPELTAQMESEKNLRNWLSYGIFVACFIPLIFGGKIYNVLLRIMVVKVIFVLGYLSFVALMYASPSTWAEVFGGFICLGPDAVGDWGFRLLPDTQGGAPLNWALLGAFAAIAGQGGMNNSQFSSYCRDRGWGMGQHVGAIPSIVGGREVTLKHTGKRFPINPESMVKFRGWMRVLYRDQWCIWFVGCVLGVAIPAIISLQFIRGQTLSGDVVAAATAKALWDHTGNSAFWFLTLLCGFVVMAPSQITAADGLVRRWTEQIWVGSKKLEKLDDGKVRYVYFSMLVAYMVWGLVILVWTGSKPLAIVQASTAIMNFALGFSALHTLATNLILLPKEVRPGWLARCCLVFCAVFFIGIAILSVPKTLTDLGLR